MNGQRLIKLLELAGRPSTNENEALNALRMVAGQLEAAGYTWTDLPTILGVDVSRLTTQRTINDPQQARRIGELTGLLELANQRIAHLEATPRIKVVEKIVVDPTLQARVDELERLIQAGDAAVNSLREELRVTQRRVDNQPSNHTTGVSWEVFSRLAEKLLGHGWQEQHQRFGASKAMITRWSKADEVPVEYLEKLSRLRAVQVERRTLSSR